MTTPAEQRDLIAAYVDTINRRDAEGIAALFAEDAVQADPASNPPNVGREAIRTFFENSISASESWTFTAKAVHTCADHVAIDFEISLVTGGATMVDRRHRGLRGGRRRAVHLGPRLLGRRRPQLPLSRRIPGRADAGRVQADPGHVQADLTGPPPSS